MKTFHALSSLFVFFTLKILININKEFLDRNFFRVDDFVNTLIVFVLLIFVYTNKEKFIEYQPKKSNRFFFSVIIVSIIFHTYRTLINLPYSFLHSDNVISTLHVNRMIEFGLNVYHATWNEHTTLLIYIQKYAIQIFRIFGFENDLLIYFTVFILFTSLSSLLILKLSYFFTDYKAIGFAVGTLYFIDSVGAGNRTLRFDTRSFGSFLMLLFMYFLYEYTKNKNINNLYMTVVVGTFAMFNLESYSLTILTLFLTFIYVEKPGLRIIGKLFITFFSTVSSIFLFHFLTDQLNDLINLNILFHLQSSRVESVNLLYAISGVEFFPGLNLYLFIFLLWPIFLLRYKNYLKNKNIIYLNSYILGELLHLILTGPRWIAYGQIMRIPLMIILCIYLDRFAVKIGLNKSFDNFKYKISTSLLIPLVLTAFIGGPSIFNFKTERQKEILIGESSRIEIIQLIEENTENNAYFLWTENKNWSWMFLDSNYLPATRMWLWVQAYEENKSYFSWSDRWGLEKIQKYWLEDIETEKVDIFVIDKNFINLPNFINQYITENSELVRCISDFCLYKK